MRRVSKFAVVEVAPTVRTLLTSAEVVPMETLSVLVVSLTKVPSSLQPDIFPVSASAPQTIFPEASVSKVEAPLQLRIVPIWIPPAETMTPPAREEVAAEVERILPPVRVSPWLDANPPPATDRPEAVKVEVAEEVFKIFPPVRVNPWEELRLKAVIPPVKVEVPVPPT
jgi:hypothetical protein